MRKLFIHKKGNVESTELLEQMHDWQISEITESIPSALRSIITKTPALVLESATRPGMIVKELYPPNITKENIDKVEDFPAIPIPKPKSQEPLTELKLKSSSGKTYKLEIDDTGTEPKLKISEVQSKAL